MAAGVKRGEILLALGSTFVAVVLAESALRAFDIGSPRPTGYAPVNTFNRAKVAKNSRGYRDYERSERKRPDVRRLLALGDSFTWGVGVEFEDAYPQRIERGLSRRRQEIWEVVNLALPGMNTVDEASQLAQEGMAYEPDVVLVGYVLNDSEDQAAAETRRVGEWIAEKAMPPSFWDRSYLVRLVHQRLLATAENRRRITGYKSMYLEDASGWKAARKALKDMGVLCRNNGVPFVVAVFPLFGNPLDESYPFEEIHSKVSAAAGGAGAKVVDLLPTFRGLRWEILVVDGANDEHPNEVAHRIAAGAILRALDEVIPPSRAGKSPSNNDRAAHP